jgi:integrase/recombinase XerD
MMIQKYISLDRPKLLHEGIFTSLIISHRGTPETVEGINSMLQPLKGLYPDRSLNAVTIRQSVISNMLNEKKVKLEDVQLYAGHKYPSSTERYKRHDLEEQRALINMFHPIK